MTKCKEFYIPTALNCPTELIKEIYETVKKDIPREIVSKCKYKEDWAITVYSYFY